MNVAPRRDKIDSLLLQTSEVHLGYHFSFSILVEVLFVCFSYLGGEFLMPFLCGPQKVCSPTFHKGRMN